MDDGFGGGRLGGPRFTVTGQWNPSLSWDDETFIYSPTFEGSKSFIAKIIRWLLTQEIAGGGGRPQPGGGRGGAVGARPALEQAKAAKKKATVGAMPRRAPRQ
jgi:hypothetical protein